MENSEVERKQGKDGDISRVYSASLTPLNQ